MDMGDVGRRVLKANAVQRKIDFVKKQPDFKGKAEMLTNLEAEKRFELEVGSEQGELQLPVGKSK